MHTFLLTSKMQCGHTIPHKYCNTHKHTFYVYPCTVVFFIQKDEYSSCVFFFIHISLYKRDEMCKRNITTTIIIIKNKYEKNNKYPKYFCVICV